MRVSEIFTSGHGGGHDDCDDDWYRRYWDDCDRHHRHWDDCHRHDRCWDYCD